MSKLLFTFFTAAALSLTAGCTHAKADALDVAIAAGTTLNATTQRCIAYTKAHNGDMHTPSCDVSKEQAAYLAAKAKVRAASPALEAIDQQQKILMSDMMQLVFSSK